VGLKNDKKRVQKRYWREVKGHLYARLQYQDDTGKWKEKLKPISDKRTALRVVEEMRRELDVHGQEILTSDKMTFAELATAYEAKMSPAVFENGIKISGRKSSIDWMVNPWLIILGQNKFARSSRVIWEISKTSNQMELPDAAINEKLPRSIVNSKFCGRCSILPCKTNGLLKIHSP